MQRLFQRDASGWSKLTNQGVGVPYAEDKAYLKGDNTMEHTTAYHEDVIAVCQSDKYGHPQRVTITKIASLTPRRPSAAPRADRYGHAPSNDRSQRFAYASADV